VGWLRVSSRRAAYVVLALLTLVWGLNWICMKGALLHAHPLAFNVQRTWLAVAVLFVALIARGGRIGPHSWRAVLVTAFFQTTINFGATTMAVAGGGAGRASVLVFTMPFWTLLMAWPVLHERVRGAQMVAIAFAVAGLVVMVAPWDWHGDLAPKAWGALSGFGWAAGTVAFKYFQRDADFDMLTFITWQMALGVMPLGTVRKLFGVERAAGRAGKANSLDCAGHHRDKSAPERALREIRRLIWTPASELLDCGPQTECRAIRAALVVADDHSDVRIVR
jgi:drug/metabolite transporter (DMT)-like permease